MLFKNCYVANVN